MPLALRTATPADQPLLLQVYASTRAAELATVDWSPEQKATFCEMQFQAQQQHYHQHYPTAEYYVLEHQGEAVGRLYVDSWPSQLRIMDIALLPQWCGQGLGSQCLQQLMQRATAAGQKLTIHVESFNPAMRLYERLGFRVTEDKGVYQFMEWTPQ
jgi:ribosomal protein S18 acetylase RimI-like enzyme